MSHTYRVRRGHCRMNITSPLPFYRGQKKSSVFSVQDVSNENLEHTWKKFVNRFTSGVCFFPAAFTPE